MPQPSMFDRWNPVPVADSHVIEPVEQRRLSGQNLKILDRLRRGPATNRELAAISLKYTSRVSDLRAAGFTVQCVEYRSTGVTVYTLLEPAL